MDREELKLFNEFCESLEREGLLSRFYHALHENMFPGKTHLGECNMIHAIESSHQEDWQKAAEAIGA